LSVLERDPPSIEDPTKKSNEALTREPGDDDREDGEPVNEDDSDNDQQLDWMTLARECYAFSTTYIDANHRKRWEDGIRAFNSQHSQDSKYLSPAYQKRSSVYRPKPRSIMRKNEAAAASAFFSNSDVVDIQPENQGDPIQRASAEVNKMLLQYRLAKSIRWFHTVLGALQDAQKVGNCAARVYWEFEQDSKGKVLKDKPRVDLIPIENLRIDPAADWSDPIATTPYIIHLMPMYVVDVKERMTRKDPKTGRPTWHPVPDSVLRNATQTMPDSTAMVREKNREDPKDTENRPVQDYTIVWIQRHIHRRGGIDWEFYTLSDQALLTTPQPLEKSTWHGRDYVVGCCILETHTSMPSSMYELGKQLFEETNEITNQRLDNVKLVLNKRWIVKRNRNVDVVSLARNVPGSNTMADDPEKDIREVNWPDVTASSFQEQDRLQMETDELMGNFNPATSPMQGRLGEKVGGAQLMTSAASILTEYMLRTFVETFVEPVLKLLVKLEQNYETDEVVLSLAAEKAQIRQRYGINHVTDSLLNQELTTRVNVGMGATDPTSKMGRFTLALNTYAAAVKAMIPGLNTSEVAKEVFGYAGYQDGRRFMTNDNPQVAQLTQMLQAAHLQTMQLQKQIEDRTQDNQTKVEVAKINNEGKEKAAAIAHPHGLDPIHGHVLKAHELAIKHEADISKLEAELKKFIMEQSAKIQLEREKMQLQRELGAQKIKHEAKAGKDGGGEGHHSPPITVNVVMPKHDKTIHIEKGKDGSMIGHVKGSDG
jgi:hypothetical protein